MTWLNITMSIDALKRLSEIRGYSFNQETMKYNEDINIVYFLYEIPKHITEINNLAYNNNIVILKNKIDIFPKISAKYHSYIFFAYELLFCPIDHILVPRHRLATDSEINNLTPDLKLPIILSTDIICRWHGFPLNSIIAIEREDGTYFRKLVAADK